MNYIDTIKNKALQKKITFEKHTTLFETLSKGVSWNIPQTYTQQEIVEWNLEMDSRSCFGRVVDAAVIAEKHFPQTPLLFGEVVEDVLAQMLLMDIHKGNHPDSYFHELLMYEEPHLVAVVDGVQYEPLSQQLGAMIRHPKVETLPVWESIAATVLISESLMTKDLVLRKKFLDQAKELSPRLMIVDEHLAAYSTIVDYGSCVEKYKALVARRMTARNLFLLYLHTENSSYKQQLCDIYTSQMYDILHEQAMDVARNM